MKFVPTSIEGAYLVRVTPQGDERGLFARTWCAEEFAQAGINPTLTQCSTSFNRIRGTLRGLHWQVAPHQEDKLVRCTRGAIFDVGVDLRPESPSYLAHVVAHLDADNRAALFLPKGCAHGFLTLAVDTEVFYQMSASYAAHAQRGARWDDPAFRIPWPEQPVLISDRDRSYPDYQVSAAQ